MTATEEDFVQVREIGPEISASLTSFFQEDRNRQVIDRLVERGLSIAASPAQRRTGGQSLAGRTFVFTGGLADYSRDQAKELVEQHGGQVTSSVSKKTSYVVAGTDLLQTRTAQKLGVKILTEAEFTDLVKPA